MTMPVKRSASRAAGSRSARDDAAAPPAKKRGRPASASSAAKPAKKSKIDHHSHCTNPGIVHTVGEGDVGQLGLGPDTMERARAAAVTLPKQAIQAVAGGMHTACLLEDGDVYTFGCNDEGALGRDTSVEDSDYTPAKLETGLKFVQISAGDSHTALLTAEGEVHACGTFRDANGSIGLTEAGPQKTAIHLPCERRIVKIVSGGDHILALSEEGDIFSTGCAEQGQLGRVAECFATRGGRKGLGHLLTFQQVHFRGTKKNRHPKAFDDIWAGTYVSFAKSSNGDIWAWGLNNYYQLGTGDMENKYVPALVPALTADKDWTCIAAGQHHTVALNKSGEIYTLGRGTYGQLGLGESATADAVEPAHIQSFSETCSQVAASSSVSFAVSKSNVGYAWGMGTSKQLCNGEEVDQFEPKQMSGKQINDKLILMISAGGQHTVLLAKPKPDSGDDKA